jgi:hypothetical protein
MGVSKAIIIRIKKGSHHQRQEDGQESECCVKRRGVGIDLCAVITSASLGLSAAERHALYFFCTCQIDLARLSEFRSMEIIMTQDNTHCKTGYEPEYFAVLMNLMGILTPSTRSRRSTGGQT